MVLQTESFLFGVKGQVHPKMNSLSLRIECPGMFLCPRNISGASQQNRDSWRLVFKRKNFFEKIKKMASYRFSAVT